MISSLILSLMISGSSYKVQRKNPTFYQNRANQIVRYLRKQDPKVLRRVMRSMRWQNIRKPKKCPKVNPKSKSTYEQWEERMLLDLMLPR